MEQECKECGATYGLVCHNCEKEKYHALCIEDSCYQIITENDIERNATGEIYERSKKCWNCRTLKDRLAIKKWRQKQRKGNSHLTNCTPSSPCPTCIAREESLSTKE